AKASERRPGRAAGAVGASAHRRGGRARRWGRRGGGRGRPWRRRGRAGGAEDQNRGYGYQAVAHDLLDASSARQVANGGQKGASGASAGGSCLVIAVALRARAPSSH